MRNLLVVFLLFSAVVYADSYQRMDFDKLMKYQKNDSCAADKCETISINTEYLDEIIQQLWLRAGEYPLKFDSEVDKKAAYVDLLKLLKLLEFALENNPNSSQNHLTYARLGVMAYNFDNPKGAKIANSSYQKFLSMDNVARVRGEYGAFLASSMQAQQAHQQLEQAVADGYRPALYSLALLDLKDKPEQAQKKLEEYVQEFPNDKNASDFLQALKSGATLLDCSADLNANVDCKKKK
ncbi:MAG: hypothetical protein IJ566_05195 [Cardiobacteriaceae bacterium]|nr:hypothetical protein [Cardiobacteriaceae bacterium]